MVRAQVLNPKTGKYFDTTRTTKEGEKIGEARDLLRELEKGSSGPGGTGARTRFLDYATQSIESRIARGKIMSPESKLKSWNVLKLHLAPRWGDMFVDAIMRSDVEKWLIDLGKGVQAKRYTPKTVNTWWSQFKAIMSAAAATFDIKDPTARLDGIPDHLHRTYTDEQPNSLLVQELPAFFDAAWNYEREHFAMIVLGQLTGRRACELRPLRRQGPFADLDWATGKMLIRRSQTIGEAMEVTKTKDDVTLYLPTTLVDILRTHVANLSAYRKESDLLFPPRHPRLENTAGYMSKSALDKPLRRICAMAGIKKHLTAKGAMRRTYQQLCKAAQVDDVVQMAMSGHATKEMMMLYSSASADAKRSALERMSAIAGLKEAARLT